MGFRYSDLASAARGVLAEVVHVVSNVGRPYVVVGGWSPLLLNAQPIAHPGTHDVDLLFRHGATTGELADVVHALLAHGYLSSAKHSFQLLRVVEIHDREFVFNVDLIHPDPVLGTRASMFVDHLVLDDLPMLYRYQSIVVPMSALLFEEAGAVSFAMQSTTPSGSEVSVQIPLMTELGTLLTKSRSMSNPKRTRDAFDIFLAILQARDRAFLADQIRQNDIQDALAPLWRLVNDPTMRANIAEYWPGAAHDPTWLQSVASLKEFFEDASLKTHKDQSDQPARSLPCVHLHVVSRVGLDILLG